MQVVLVSFGYKYGIPLDSDLVFDARFLPNPFYVDRLRDRNGRTRSVRDYVLGTPETKTFLRELFAFVDRLIPRSSGGRAPRPSRSAVRKHRRRRRRRARAHLRGPGAGTKIYHRDIYK
jgi:UPF0042 nucleotide-binding protein